MADIASPLIEFRHVEHVMGMPVSLAARVAVPPQALSDAMALLHDVDHVFSTYRADSDISRLGRGELSLDQTRPEVAIVLAACESLHRQTDGWFDAWAAPDGASAQLDPSGYVKGWAVERAAGVLRAAGVASFCLNAGGDIVVRATADEPSWRIGIRHPTEPMLVAAVVAGRRLAIATSGTYERGAHILDPHSGRPATALASITVTGDDLGLVDAYATAAFAMGEAGPAWVARQPGYGVFAITHDGHTLSNPEFDDVRVS